MMYSLNIGGVKRWLTLSNESNKKFLLSESDHDIPPRTPPKDSGTTPRDMRRYSKLSSPSNRLIKPHTSQVMSSDLAEKLIKAEITAEHAIAYETYVTKFQPESCIETNPTSLHADYTIFRSHVSFGDSVKCISRFPTTSDILSKHSLKESKTDQVQYAIYVESSKITNKYILPTTAQDFNRYESYRRWVDQGSLGQLIV